MKNLLLLSLLVVSCSHQPNTVARDTLAWGNVEARATKVENCFQIELELTGATQAQAAPKNWTLAWVDGEGVQHPVALQQRDPASAPAGGDVVTPYGHFEKWNNSFTTCLGSSEASQVRGLVLTPKTLNYDFQKGLELNWK